MCILQAWGQEFLIEKMQYNSKNNIHLFETFKTFIYTSEKFLLQIHYVSFLLVFLY